MPVWNLSINIGSNHEGQTRRKAYERAADQKGVTLNEWVKSTLDAAAGIKIVKEE